MTRTEALQDLMTRMSPDELQDAIARYLESLSYYVTEVE